MARNSRGQTPRDRKSRDYQRADVGGSLRRRVARRTEKALDTRRYRRTAQMELERTTASRPEFVDDDAGGRIPKKRGDVWWDGTHERLAEAVERKLERREWLETPAAAARRLRIDEMNRRRREEREASAYHRNCMEQRLAAEAARQLAIEAARQALPEKWPRIARELGVIADDTGADA